MALSLNGLYVDMDQKTICVLSQGCAANFGEGERIAQWIHQAGYEVIFDFPSNVPSGFLLNVCTVKGNQSAIKLIQKASEEYPNTPILVVGCVLDDLIKELDRFYPDVSTSSLKHIQEFPEVISLVFSEHQKIQAVSNSKFLFKKSPDLSKRENQSVGIVNISQGCLNACAFCSTHLVKGIHRSIPVNQIIEEVRFLVSDGAKEILLTGQDTSCYGFDFGTNLAALVRQILEQVPGHYYLRLGMGNPRHLKKYFDELLEVYEDGRIYKFIHLPIQSGSDSVLKKMRRQNSVADYLNLVEKFKNKFSKLTLSTDIIVGFPGETDDDFNSTVKLIEETRPSLCNITRFVARPGTPAFEMSPKVLKSIQSERSAALSAIFQKIALENNQEWIDWEGEVLIEKEGFRKGTSIGRNFAYRPVALKGNFPIGSFYDVKVKAAETFALIAEII